MIDIRNRYLYLITISIFGYILSFLNQLVISNFFGTSSNLDSFWAAVAIANFLCFYVHPFREALIPAIHQKSKISTHEAGEILSAGLSFLIFLILISTLLLLIFPDSGIDFFMNGAGKAGSLKKLLPWFLPFLWLFGLSELLNSVLLSFNRIVYQSVVRLVASVVSLLLLILMAPSFGTVAIIYGLLGSQLIVVAMSWYRLKDYPLTIKIRPIAVLKENNFFGLFGALLFNYLIAQFYVLSERVSMVKLKLGLLSSFQYGTSLVNVLISVMAIPIANMLWHHFLESKVSGDHKSSSIYAAKMMGLLFILLLFICAFLYQHAQEFIYLIFSRGKFDQDSLITTTQAFRATIFAAVPIGLLSILAKFFLSLGRGRDSIYIGVSIALSGLLIILISLLLNNSMIIQWHWFFGNSVGLLVGLLMFYIKSNFTSRDLKKTIGFIGSGLLIFLLLFVFQPNFSFGHEKLMMFFALLTDFFSYLLFMVLLVLITRFWRSIKSLIEAFR